MRSLGAAQLRDITRLFGWRPADAVRAVDALARTGRVLKDCQIEGQPGEWLALTELS
jgi:hypothetical protein